jgi:hypothetical protein
MIRRRKCRDKHATERTQAPWVGRQRDHENTAQSELGLDLRGTRFKVLGTGLMSRLSLLSSSSCFLMMGLVAETGSITLRWGDWATEEWVRGKMGGQALADFQFQGSSRLQIQPSNSFLSPAISNVHVHCLPSAQVPAPSLSRPTSVLTVPTAPGSPFSFPALPRTRPCRVAPSPNLTSKDGLCTGRSSASSWLLNMLPNGPSAGKYSIPSCNRASILTLTMTRLPFYWEVKTLFLLYLSLPQTQVHLFSFVAS